MTYAELTYHSHNRLKRLVQRHRYQAMLRLVSDGSDVSVLDYGCGDGFFLRLLQSLGIAPDRLIGYEPFGSMAAQFETGPDRPNLIGDTEGLDRLAVDGTTPRRFSHIFCMEVLEHLDDADLAVALDRITELAGADTRIIVAVPVELGLAGAVKCLFRWMAGSESVSTRTIRSVLRGRAPPRLVSETPEGRYIYSHIGFDHRRLGEELARRFRVEERFGVPFRHLPLALNNEAAFICRPR
ncbi:hypothetical protein N825_27865 [Skermanella stibiiresistens SB22]|uniref:Methyltransferase domain-containing protein n=1 Tax=Skermanella stibiiresistens SB22 TaxID=1385369 RepID=W9H624_9PROT|nr:methyltransferase domain-containing protein [Skermanella stibiiresistens]EWY41514.1 hypothetical protein N825_27865 [Skermanella stibiiresistens SB22]